jgi:hypothetical protein
MFIKSQVLVIILSFINKYKYNYIYLYKICSKKKLILTYDPIDSENQIYLTDLTKQSTNCILRKINQKKIFFER